MARLRRVTPGVTPGYTRRRRGGGFELRDAAGAPLPPAERERVRALAIPPAWRDVWIAAQPHAHVLAVGTDAAGRRQYLYHPAWRESHDRDKFGRMRALARALPAARARVTRDLRTDGPERTRALAAAFRILDTAAIRVGRDEYAASSGSRGVATLLGRHCRIDDDRVTLRFPAKGGIPTTIVVDDADLAAALDALRGGASARLLGWRDDRGRHAIHASDVNAFVAERTGGSFTAKDFRTLRGTLVAAQELAALANATEPPGSERRWRRWERAAVVAAAAALGNTPAVARASYIDPTVFARARAGRWLARRGSPEAALLALLDE